MSFRESNALCLLCLLNLYLSNLKKGEERVISAKVYRQPGYKGRGRYAFVCVDVLSLFCVYKISIFL